MTLQDEGQNAASESGSHPFAAPLSIRPRSAREPVRPPDLIYALDDHPPSIFRTTTST